MGDGGVGGSGNDADATLGPDAFGLPGVFGSEAGTLGGGADFGAGDQGVGTGGVMDTKVIPVGGPEIKGEETPKVEEAKKAVSRSTRRRTLLDDEEGGPESTPIYRRSILGS